MKSLPVPVTPAPAPVLVLALAAKAEHFAAPTDAATDNSEATQLVKMQLVALFVIFERPGPHWQPMSVRPQPEPSMAVLRQGSFGMLEPES